MFPILITLDGNIGAGKSTLLEAIRRDLGDMVTVIQEPVGMWMNMKNAEGKSLLELFYSDIPRWAYTFQNCAILTRLLETQKILKAYSAGEIKTPVIITERSVLTDRHVFAQMLKSQRKLDDIEWQLYMKWFDAFAAEMPYKGIIHLATSAETSKDRIGKRQRAGEEGIPITYLNDLDAAHHAWMSSADLPVLQISSEPGIALDALTTKIRDWLKEQKWVPT
jgi:deoxycitidine kinase/deoxyguanosine kinase